jgi:hypothetical protein
MYNLFCNLGGYINYFDNDRSGQFDEDQRVTLVDFM